PKFARVTTSLEQESGGTSVFSTRPMAELKPERSVGMLQGTAELRFLPLILASGFAVACFMTQVGCASRRNQIRDAQVAFANGDLSSARESLLEIAHSRSHARDAAQLDLAMVELAAGDAEAAENRLRILRDRFDALPDSAPIREAKSLITDDRSRLFRPTGYEEVMIRGMLAICSLATDQTDAEAYSLQAEMKQTELARLAEERGLASQWVAAGEKSFQPIAFAPYLRGMLREATHRNYDDATRAYQLVSQVQPDFIPAHEDIARASGGVHSRPGHGVVYVLACVGRGPVLTETTAETTSTALSIASSILNAETNDSDDDEKDESVPVLPNIASVKVPTVSIPPQTIQAIGVLVDGQLFGQTQTLTDVTDLAVGQLNSEMPWTIARAVVRRATKESMIAAASDQMGIQGDAGRLFHFAAASAWGASESADTRCWGLLPREIQVLRAELPVGTHQIGLSPMNVGGQSAGPMARQDVTVVDGRNHYVVAIAPDRFVHLVNN
ncbi:MAG: hypothetical protein AAGA03_20130, partial [Planctomycetota bacterium]